MWSYRVVFSPPGFCHNPRLENRIEDLPVQEFVSQLAVEGFDIPVLPGTSRLDEERLHSQALQPATEDL